MRVRAKEVGFYKSRRHPGEVFEVPDGMKLGSWMEEVDAKAALGKAKLIPNKGPSTEMKIDPLIDSKNKDRKPSKHDMALA